MTFFDQSVRNLIFLDTNIHSSQCDGIYLQDRHSGTSACIPSSAAQKPNGLGGCQSIAVDDEDDGYTARRVGQRRGLRGREKNDFEARK